MENKLRVHNLRISFRTVAGKLQAVRDINFDLKTGETLAIVGESGSGKSVTSKAILGILANNSIIEGGEILYDGQDLLKIGEDDFYKIRGDKIAMIFQDPLSSLNPIMRIGKQLTEAMLLKGKARQRASKVNFKAKLDLLEKLMTQDNPAQGEEAKRQCRLFHQIVLKHIALEQSYNNALESAKDALAEVEDILFLIEKRALQEAPVRFREVAEFSHKSVHPFVVSERGDELNASADGLTKNLNRQAKAGDYSDSAIQLMAISGILKEALAKSKPDFFAMGYAQVKGISGAAQSDVAAFNRENIRRLNDEFLLSFIERAKDSIAKNDAAYLTAREKAARELTEVLALIENGTIEDIRARAPGLCKLVDESIDPLDIVKDSAACTFSGSLKGFIEQYDLGLRTNDKKVAKYDAQVRQHALRVAAGKAANWKVVAPSIVDLELVRQNIVGLIRYLLAHYTEKNRMEAHDDKRRKAERLIEYLKENASGMVLNITKRAARNRALKLMEEVGISDPRRRFRQYPFEFSGGMRQRIVIAIALAANPDILICDEPTTALDVTIQAQILELINKLKEERNLSIIFITHDLGVVAKMADRIAVMYAGKIVEYGSSEEIFYAPAHPYTWALLTSMPHLETKEKLVPIPGTPPNMIFPPQGDAFADRNHYAMKVDFERQPPEFQITDTHWAATWLLHPDAPKVDPPKNVTERVKKMKARMDVDANA